MATSVFIETTIPSYYVSRPSRDLLQAARQMLTRQWWDDKRSDFDLFTSQVVLDEVATGEPAKATERLRLLADVPLLAVTMQVRVLAAKLIKDRILPPTAGRDAAHLAVAAVYRMRFLLTWNCRHIANPFISKRLESCFSSEGVHFPVICTPQQFFPDDSSED